MNNKLSEVISQIKSEISVNAEGKATFSIRATARICDVSMQTLSKQFIDATSSADNCKLSKLTETLLNNGFISDNLKNFAITGIPDLAVAIIIEYYAFEAKQYCTEQAKLVYRVFANIGIRSWAQEITGWTKKEVATLKSNKNDKMVRINY